MTVTARRELVLGAYLSYGTGHHAAAWRHPEAVADGAQNIGHYVNLARTAERGLFDFMFLSDTPSVFNDDQDGYGGRVVVFEPMTLLSALAMTTTHLGLIATSSTTYKEPYNVAREFASLDLISGGRAGWNLVTSSKSDAARNFGLPAHPDHDARYERAAEFYDVVTGLWDSWDDDALPRDKEGGRFYDPRRRHPLRHEGPAFRVLGELNISRPVQGHPVIVQAGSSEAGKELAARTAEIVFTAQPDPERGSAFARDLKARLGRFPRVNPDVLVLPGLCPFTGPTDEIARERFEQLQRLIHPRLGVAMLSDLVGGFDLSGYDVDGPLPRLPPSNGNQSRRALIERLAREDGLSIRQLYERMTVARGHAVVIGSYQRVAETMAEWLEAGAADGFNIMPPYLPGALDEFVDHVVPRLQALGVYKQSYRDGTLRDKLGLLRPPSRYARSRVLTGR
ncbi:FMN-dependent oxidoreductase (nitrilotriacetate monooxygenase family) [Amycolatopsis bartoniae]|uniref:Nitrilotriacetate monooxygenase subunit A n=1 Tax=Amycolatopsis bartoniae TaxID=941986 RepID=A0A8H9J3L9_9PSEU|nr:LLM class flavin-dependent oxidoreductase [Amycolatopsis bartoniae]MBB2938599.1 FMN-dependent oxidoreductase (nitrilotriacetate monooxygenase family) [Amycolatopsis bartoniae]TVT08900.1 LLM class flavin-dependent oxidoreductase [Amycolatopsis bartoniae]GHF69849.1 nitrilotriacetate monooxygenase subunit A [Amycolatopsis bartoniae]